VLRLIISYAKKITNSEGEKKLEDYLKMNSVNPNQIYRKIDDENNEPEYDIDEILLEKKRNRKNNEMDASLIRDNGNYEFKQKIKTVWKFEKKPFVDFPFEDEDCIRKITKIDIEEIKELEDVMIELENEFKQLDHDKILETLRSVSFDLEKAYLILADYEYYQSTYLKNYILDLAFSENEDYIIQNMKKLSYYKKLQFEKGIISVEEREDFLKKK